MVVLLVTLGRCVMKFVQLDYMVKTAQKNVDIVPVARPVIHLLDTA
jgi:hypothetical protein